VLSPEELAAYKQGSSSGAPNPFFKESRLRPRPFIRGTAEEIASGVTDAALNVAQLAAPESVGRSVRTAAGGAPKLEGSFSHVVKNVFKSPEEFARAKLKRSLKADEVTKEQAMAKINKPGQSLSDLGSTSVTEASEQAALSGEGRRLGAKLYFDERMKGREGRVATAIDNLVSDKEMYELLDHSNTARKTAATPLYDEAFNGDYSSDDMHDHLMGELESANKEVRAARQEAYDIDNRIKSGDIHPSGKGKMEQEFDEASKAVADAQQEVNDAGNAHTLASGKEYGAQGIAPDARRAADLRSAGDKIDAAQEKLSAAQKRKEDALGNLQRSRQAVKQRFETDRASAMDRAKKAEQREMDAITRLTEMEEHQRRGIKGGVWSPRLQEFLNDPILQQGMSEGVRTIQLEALGEGKPFIPQDYALTGPNVPYKLADPEAMDAGTNLPSVSKVPNLRVLDAGKRGLDAMLEKFRNPNTGKLELNERGRAIEIVRKGYLKELDELTKNNPAYKAARDAWGGPSRVIDAVHDGRDFMKLDPEEIQARMKGMTPDQLDGYRVGASRALSDMVTSGQNGALNAAKRIADSTRMKERLEVILGKEKADAMVEMAQQEIDYQSRANDILRGSQTARRQAASQEFESLGAGIDLGLSAMRHSWTGAAASLKTLGGRFAANWVSQKIGYLSQARRDALGKLLFSTNREDNMRALELLYDEGHVTLPKYSKRGIATQAALASHAVQQPQQ
jgi:hypothetical protein